MAFNLEEYKKATIQRGKELTAESLRERLAKGTLKERDLSPRDKEILAEIPPKQPGQNAR